MHSSTPWAIHSPLQSHCLSLKWRCQTSVGVKFNWIRSQQACQDQCFCRQMFHAVCPITCIFSAPLQGDSVLPTSLREKLRHREIDFLKITQLENSTAECQTQTYPRPFRTRGSNQEEEEEGVKLPREEKSDQKHEALVGGGWVWTQGAGGCLCLPCSPRWCDPPYKDVAVMSTLRARGWWLGHP